MIKQYDYQFNISISEVGYHTKEEAKAALPYYIDRGSKTMNPDLCYFRKTETTIENLADMLSHGHTCCGVYKDRRFTASSKSEENFRYTKAMFYDIDDSSVSMSEFLQGVEYKPSIAYETFSDTSENHRFRLVYVLEDFVNKFNFEYVYHRIADVCFSSSVSLDIRGLAQCYYGTSPNKTLVNYGRVYSFEDFGIEIPSMGLGTILVAGQPVRYFSRLIPSENGHYFTLPTPYYEVYHTFTYNRVTQKPEVKKLKDGQGRRRSLWRKGQVYMKLNEGMSRDLLFKTLCYELDHYCENDVDPIPLHGERSIESITDDVWENWDKVPIEDFKKNRQFKINPEYWKRVFAEGNQRYVPVVAAAKCRKEIYDGILDKHYDPLLTVKDNLQKLRDKGYTFSRFRLYIYRREHKLMKRSAMFETYNLSNTSITIITLLKQNERFKTKDIASELNVSEQTVRRHLAFLKKKELIRNEGTKKEPRWVVLKEETPVFTYENYIN